MRTTKRPPPDNEGNLRGRMKLLRVSARQNARLAVREGADYDKALARQLKAIEPGLKDLRARLERVRKGLPEPAEPPQEAPKKRSATRVPADYEDLLDTLASL
jgi:hypothetical protein